MYVTFHTLENKEKLFQFLVYTVYYLLIEFFYAFKTKNITTESALRK